MAELTIARKNPAAPLTASEVKAALAHPPLKGQRRVLRETGLILRIDDTGTGCWAMERKILGEQLRRAIGYSDKMGLAEARREAARTYALILAGSDPLQVRREATARKAEERQARREARAALLSPQQLAEERGKHGYAPSGRSLRDVLDRFQAEVAISDRKPIRGWYAQRKAVEHHFRDWLTRDVAELTDDDVRAVLRKGFTSGRPIGAKRCCQYAGRIYEQAVAWRIVPANPFRGIDYDRLAGKEEPRERCLSEDEVGQLWRAAEAEGGTFGSLCRLYLLLGSRREELAGRKWSDIVQVHDENDRSKHLVALKIGKTKNGKPQHLPLSAKALEIIEAMPREAERIFPLPHRPNWTYHMEKLLKLAQIDEHVTWHDLRRTASTLLASIGTDDLIRELILAHTLPGKLRQTYVRYDYLRPQVDALEALAGRIARIVSDGSCIVPFVRAG